MKITYKGHIQNINAKMANMQYQMVKEALVKFIVNLASLLKSVIYSTNYMPFLTQWHHFFCLNHIQVRERRKRVNIYMPFFLIFFWLFPPSFFVDISTFLLSSFFSSHRRRKKKSTGCLSSLLSSKKSTLFVCYVIYIFPAS